ncbi:MAG: glycerol-3-phosphate 1-O-acyltransferase PlsY [Phycisphaerales bacterium]|jgi:acyl phosphate:glycerol-3-phosphate acyltransferase|nr:glycerol-3-phosphate 1-O-acyltransferase PlsY [Phycisphaerales bacterium]MBT7171605.1 glycerol-3-phosphate 1-O-acyltransferase PlsY [Phycisphaerales bacterium]
MIPHYLLPLAGYLIGSLSFATLIARIHGVDLRTVGSGNPGATNVGRTLGRKWGYLCFLLDVLKGLLPTLAAGHILHIQSSTIPTVEIQWLWVATGAACVLGHVFSCFLKFRGGKGVATALGMLLGLWPYLTLPSLVLLGAWVVIVLATRYVSLASVLAALALPGAFVVINGLREGWENLLDLWPIFTIAASLAVLVVVRHGSNLKRIRAGSEHKITLPWARPKA